MDDIFTELNLETLAALFSTRNNRSFDSSVNE